MGDNNQNNQNVKIEYPYQAFVRKTQVKKGNNGIIKKTLNVDVHCDPTEPGQSPLEIFGPTSRAKITILRIDEENGRRVSSLSPWANLPQRDFASVMNKSQQASMNGAQTHSMQSMLANVATKEDVKSIRDLVKQAFGMLHNMLNCLASLIRTGQMPQQLAPQAQQTSSQTPQANVEELCKIASANKLKGVMKNHTPLSFMKENNSEEGKQKMLGQIKYLESNLTEHPNNQQLIDSIKAAIMLYDLKQLDGSGSGVASVSSNDIVIYESGPKGLNRKVKEDGFGPVKELSIVWHIGDTYPVEISIKNYDAPIETKSNGAINVMVSKRREPVIQESYRLSEVDYFDLLDKIRMNYERYSMMMAVAQFKASADASYSNYQAYKGQQQTHQGAQNQYAAQAQQPVQAPQGQYNYQVGQPTYQGAQNQYVPQAQQAVQQQNVMAGQQAQNVQADYQNGFGKDPFAQGSGSLDATLPFGNMGASPFGGFQN